MNSVPAVTESVSKPEKPNLRLLYDECQPNMSAMIRLQWCLNSAAVKLLGESTSREEPLLFLSVTGPHGHEDRFLYKVNDVQVVVPFHAPGEHAIRARVLHGWSHKKAMEKCLGKRSRYEWYESIDWLFKGLPDNFGNAELVVEVPNDGSYFAKELSARMEWWINLWYHEPWWDQCGLNHRKMVAFTIQPPIVALYVAFKTLHRFLIAFWFGFLLAQRGIQWHVIWHPFICGRRQIYDYYQRKYFTKNPGSALFYDKNGANRGSVGFALWFLMPLIQMFFFLFVAIVVAVKLHIERPETHLTVASLAMLCLENWISILVLMYLAGGIVAGVIKGGGWLFRAFNARFPMPAKAVSAVTEILDDGFTAIFAEFRNVADAVSERYATYQKERASRMQKEGRGVFADRYAFLACEQAPPIGAGIRPNIPGPVRVAQRVRLFAQEVKLNHCQPRARR